jgi:TrmH family RNA methyltransferase
MRTALGVSGTKRRHTVLLGEKLVLEWYAAKAHTQLIPVRWLRLEGCEAHPVEYQLPLETWELRESLMRDISGTASPPALALVVELADDPVGPLADRVIVPWGIQDPGNLGAILRSALAFGFQEALLGLGCTDPFNPRALRGSMGAALLMPLRRFEEKHFDDGRWIALDSGFEAEPLNSVDLTPPLRLMVGNEGHGWRDANLPPQCIRASIPISGIESLNAAVAAGIACYEAAGRR